MAEKKDRKAAIAPREGDDRRAALASALTQIEKDFGKGSVMRLGDAAKLRPTYAAIGGFLSRCAPAYRGFVFTANPELAECVGMETRQALPFFNARLDSRLLEYGGFRLKRRPTGPEESETDAGCVGA